MANIGGKGLEGGKYRDLDREHPDLEKFKRMQKTGLPQGAIENAMMRDGILPASLFDSPLSQPDPVPAALLIKPKAALAVPAVVSSPAASASGGGGSKPPPGLSLMDEMKWRQNQKKQQTTSGGGGGDGIKLAERKKSVVEIKRAVALKPTTSSSAGSPASAPKPIGSPALFGATLRPVNASNAQPAAAAAKFTAPAYSNVLRPAAVNLAAQAAKVAEKKLADAPQPAPKFEIEMAKSAGEPIALPPSQLQQTQKTAAETVTLDDGTVVTRQQGGGFVQVSPTGVTIQQFADGATKQTNADGTVIEVNASGTLTIQVNPDGTRFESNDKGEITTCFVDGTMLHDFGNGDKRQTNPDGVTITTYADGRKVQIDAQATIEITSYPDGSIDQLDKSTGKTLHCTPDGKVEQKS